MEGSRERQRSEESEAKRELKVSSEGPGERICCEQKDVGGGKVVAGAKSQWRSSAHRCPITAQHSRIW